MSATAITDRQLIRVQAASGATFAVFALAHLLNQAIGILGPRQYDHLQGLLRRGYQWAPIELAVVITPLVVHIAACITRILRRRRSGQRASPQLSARLHRISGIFLLLVIVGHFAATRGSSFFYGIYPGFRGVAFTFRWLPAYFWPYYLALAVGGFYHAIYGLGVALPVLGFRPAGWLRRPPVLIPIVAVGAIALVLGVLAMGGVFFDVGNPAATDYAHLIARLGFAHSLVH